MKLYIYAKSYNSWGGNPHLSLAGDFLLQKAPSFGGAINEIEITLVLGDKTLLFEPCGHRIIVGQGMEGVQGEAGVKSFHLGVIRALVGGFVKGFGTLGMDFRSFRGFLGQIWARLCGDLSIERS